MSIPRCSKVFQSAQSVCEWFVRDQQKKGEGNDSAAWSALVTKYWESPTGKGWTDLEAEIWEKYAYTARQGLFLANADWGNVR